MGYLFLRIVIDIFPSVIRQIAGCILKCVISVSSSSVINGYIIALSSHSVGYLPCVDIITYNDGKRHQLVFFPRTPDFNGCRA